MPTWIADHFGIFLLSLALVSLVATVLAARAAWRTGGRLERKLKPWMSFLGAVLALFVGAAGSFIFVSGALEVIPQERAQKRLLGQAAPLLAFSRVDDGAASSLADHRGQVVLVNLWATWCPPCREEMPDLDRLQREYREQGLVVLNLSDESREILTRYLADEPMSTEHGFLDAFPWPEYGRPTTYLVDREGVIRKAFSGARSFEVFEELVTEVL